MLCDSSDALRLNNPYKRLAIIHMMHSVADYVHPVDPQLLTQLPISTLYILTYVYVLKYVYLETRE